MKRVTVRRQRVEEFDEPQPQVQRRHHRRERSVRLSERGTRAARSAPEAAPAPTPPVPELTPQPAPPQRAAAEQRARPQTQAAPRWRLLTTGRLAFVLVSVLVYCGWSTHTERYIVPNRGFGYALGIVGGSLMLVLLAYSLRKRWRWLEFLGSTPSWFKFHMVLGIAGPLCILYHSNFSTGATNSNVALFSMLTVAGSGVIGRYLYARLHDGGCKRLFSLWHSLHIPLIFVMFIAAIVHVIAAHVY